MRKSQIIAFAVLGTAILVLSSAAPYALPRPNDASTPPLNDFESGMVVQRNADALPKGLSPWFKNLDKHKDAQVAINPWRQAAKDSDKLRNYDPNEDSFVIADDVSQYGRKPIELKLENGQAIYRGAIEAGETPYRGRNTFKFFIVKLEAGKSYQFDHMSKAFDAYLYLEDPDGQLLAEDDDSGGGLDSRIVYRPATTGTYRVIAASLGGGTGVFSLSARLLSGLPSWFTNLDTDGDGQVALYEWRKAGKKRDEFRKYDLNDDGFITADELLQPLKKLDELKLDKIPLVYNGVIGDPTDARYQGRKAFKILTIRLEAGRTYQFDYLSQEFYAYLYLEDPDENIIEKNNSGGRGKYAQIVYRPAESGTHRIIATSQDGYKTGPFSLTIRVLHGLGDISPKILPKWFKELDTDGDGQVALYEWRRAGKKLDEFSEYDLNDDGFITAEEVLQAIKKNSIELKR